MTDEALRETRTRLMEVLRGNDAGGYTVPARGLYPFQWNWDSGFSALGWSCFDEPRAWREVERLLEGQWGDGMIPHIVFHGRSDEYFPGPEVWRAGASPPTSGITQPPVHGFVVANMLARARDPALAEERLAALYPALLRNLRWWRDARFADGLALCYHPWETGMDNSPAWDVPLRRVPETATPFRRRDTDHVAGSERPSDAEYARYVYLVELFRDCGYDPERLRRESPFQVADIATNAILCRSATSLGALAERFGRREERLELDTLADGVRAAAGRLWNRSRANYLSLDRTVGEPIPVSTSAGFLAPFGGFATPARVGHQSRELSRWLAGVAHGVPSLPADDPAFDARRYWRGPVWAIVNWMVARGLADYGRTNLAERLRADTRALILANGPREYFDPVSGAGLGGERFSWTSAIGLFWALDT